MNCVSKTEISYESVLSIVWCFNLSNKDEQVFLYSTVRTIYYNILQYFTLYNF